MLLDLLYGLRHVRSLRNPYDLAALRPEDLPGTAEGMATRDWFDGRDLADL